MKRFVLALALCGAMGLWSVASASAGVFLRGQDCVLNQSNNFCQFYFGVQDGTSYPCYTRMQAHGGGPYASHRTVLAIPNLGISSGGSYSTSQTVYSNQWECRGSLPEYIPGWYAQGFQAGGGSTNRGYTLQLYSGYK